MAKIIRDIYIGNYGVSQKWGVNAADYARFGMKGHNGIDFTCPQNTIVLAGHQGQVKKVAFDQNGYGWFVEIWDNYQYMMTIYAHLYSVAVPLGQWILAGQKIGMSNNSGNSTGPHLHFGVGDTDDKGNRVKQDDGFYGWYDPYDSSKIKWQITNPSTVEEAMRNAAPINEIAANAAKPIMKPIKQLQIEGVAPSEVAPPVAQPSADVQMPSTPPTKTNLPDKEEDTGIETIETAGIIALLPKLWGGLLVAFRLLIKILPFG